MKWYEGLGFNLFNQFQTVVKLEESMRQKGPEQEIFRGLLRALREGEGAVTKEHWDLISGRDYNKLNVQEKAVFDEKAIMLCAQNKRLKPFNLKKMRELGQPIAIVESVNQPNMAKNFDSNDAGGLHKNTLLCKGSRVYLQSNLNPKAGK